MTEAIEIQLSTKLDAKGLDELRKQLNESRNAMNALARDTQKGSEIWKGYKSSVAEVNKLIKMSDADLKKYAMSVVDTGKKVSNTDKQFKGFGATLKTGASAMRLVVHSALALNPLLEGQSGTLGKLHGFMDKYGVSILSVSTALGSLKQILPAINAGFLAQTGFMGTLAIGIGSVATAYGLMAQNISWAISEYQKGSSFWDIMTHGVLNPIVPETTDDGSRIKLGADLQNQTMQEVRRKLIEMGIDPDNQVEMLPGSQVGKNDWVKSQYKDKGGRVAKEKKEKVQKIIYDSLDDQIMNLFLGKVQDGFSIFGQQFPVTGMAPATLGHTPTFVNGKIDLSKFRDNFNARRDNTQEEGRDTLEDIQTGYGLIAQTMQLLNVGTDTFVGKLLSAFEFASSALNVGASIVGFIKTIVTMGGMPSAPSVMSTASMNPNVNLYLSTNANQKFFTTQIENYNANLKYRRL